MKKFFVATKNAHKVEEFKRILLPLGFEVISEKDLDKPIDDVEETGTTFEENSLIKARYGCKVTNLPTVADDSGLCVDYLSGAPGIYSARYAGEHGNYEANNQKLLKELEGVAENKRTAKFVSAISCVMPDGLEFTVIGECHGKIAFDIKGDNGFAFDRVFISSIGRFSEILPEEKDSISHRYMALLEFEKKLKNLNL